MTSLHPSEKVIGSIRCLLRNILMARHTQAKDLSHRARVDVKTVSLRKGTRYKYLSRVFSCLDVRAKGCVFVGAKFPLEIFN